MMDHTLIERMRKLIVIERAGLMPELRRVMALVRRHRPRCPEQENPWLRVDAGYLAGLMKELTGDSLKYCQVHAVEALVRTQKQEAFDLIDEFYGYATGDGKQVVTWML